MTFGAQAELTGVPNRPFPQKLASFRRMPLQLSRRKIRAECLSPEIGFVSSNAFAGGPDSRRGSVMKLTKPVKTGADPGSPAPANGQTS